MEPPTLSQLSQRLDSLDPDAKALWGKMSLAQMLVHCRMPLESGMGERQVAPKSNFFTRWLLFPLLMKIPWPKGKAQTHGEFNVVSLNLPVRSVQDEAAALAAKLKAFLAGGFQLQAHPIFGNLSMAQWLYLQRKHLDHHFRQFNI
ncbi:MAG TPA: DUF1569 domain-containing protein [Fibrobacteria bacterium]|nr:DUF1569 domain-containing protein [Fibrobacteria bacterium]